MSWAAEDRAAIADRMLYHGRDRVIAGAAALHQIAPDEAMLRAEEAAEGFLEKERHALEVEVFAGFREYLFADGPEPVMVRARIEGALRSFRPEVLPLMAGPLEWVPAAEVAQVLERRAGRLAAVRAAASSRGALSTWFTSLSEEADQRTVERTMDALLDLLLENGQRWQSAVQVAYALVKGLSPELLGGMSLAEIAILGGDAGRATPSARIKRIYSRRVEAAGLSATFLHFQKGATVVEKYRIAARGNQNRRKKRRRGGRLRG